MTIKQVFTGVAVAHYESTVEWYECLLGRPADIVPHETEAMWQLADSSWMYVVADSGRAGKGLLTLQVDDLEDHLAALAERGLTIGAIDTLPGTARKATIMDPEGNMIAFFETLSADG